MKQDCAREQVALECWQQWAWYLAAMSMVQECTTQSNLYPYPNISAAIGTAITTRRGPTGCPTIGCCCICATVKKHFCVTAEWPPSPPSTCTINFGVRLSKIIFLYCTYLCGDHIPFLHLSEARTVTFKLLSNAVVSCKVQSEKVGSTFWDCALQLTTHIVVR